MIVTEAQREEAARLYLAMIKARDAYEQFGIYVHDPSGVGACRCVLTQQVIIEGDEVLEDNETGDLVLRGAVGLGPRPEDI